MITSIKLANFKIAQLEGELAAEREKVNNQTAAIRSLTDQCAALVVEKNSLLMDHGGALCDKGKIEFLEAIIAGDGALITGLKNDIAEAQATIAEMREALEEVSGLIEESHGVVGLHLNGDEAPWDELLSGGRFERLTTLHEALAKPTNLDALHEALAKECERLMEMASEYKVRTLLYNEAAAHRARKEGK